MPATCAAKQGSIRPAVTVTSLVAGPGLLWVGTSAGVVLTLPLPRLEGVPILGGRTYLAHHGHRGPVTFLLCLQPRVHPSRRGSSRAQQHRVSQCGIVFSVGHHVNLYALSGVPNKVNGGLVEHQLDW